MANSADPDQIEEANLSGSTMFAKAGCIRVQLDKVYDIRFYQKFLISFSS